MEPNQRMVEKPGQKIDWSMLPQIPLSANVATPPSLWKAIMSMWCFETGCRATGICIWSILQIRWRRFLWKSTKVRGGKLEIKWLPYGWRRSCNRRKWRCTNCLEEKKHNFTAIPGEPEKEIGTGRDCAMVIVNNKNIYTWTEKENVVLMNSNGEKKVLGKGRQPVLKSLDNVHVICVWENEKQIHASIVKL